jgi:hypothetical protein
MFKGISIKFEAACKYYARHEYIIILKQSRRIKGVRKTQKEMEKTSLKLVIIGIVL